MKQQTKSCWHTGSKQFMRYVHTSREEKIKMMKMKIRLSIWLDLNFEQTPEFSVQPHAGSTGFGSQDTGRETWIDRKMIAILRSHERSICLSCCAGQFLQACATWNIGSERQEDKKNELMLRNEKTSKTQHELKKKEDDDDGNWIDVGTCVIDYPERRSRSKNHLLYELSVKSMCAFASHTRDEEREKKECRQTSDDAIVLIHVKERTE